MPSECTFCRIAKGEIAAAVVLENSNALAFLDHRPLFPGHCLLIPKAHYETLLDLPADLGQMFLTATQTLCAAMEDALGAQGSFVAVNNRISQSVPHVHIHVVPRRKKDGLRGFFWPRGKYRDEAEMEAVLISLRAAVERFKKSR